MRSHEGYRHDSGCPKLQPRDIPVVTPSDPRKNYLALTINQNIEQQLPEKETTGSSQFRAGILKSPYPLAFKKAVRHGAGSNSIRTWLRVYATGAARP
jgi:hypothetical protein